MAVQLRRTRSVRVARRRWLLAPVLGCAVFFGQSIAHPRVAHAQSAAEVSAARGLASEGMKAEKAGKHEEAVRKLIRAYAIIDVPSVAVWLARALANTGRLVEAAERYREAIQMEIERGSRDIQLQAKETARTELAALEPRIPQVIVDVEGAPRGEVKLTVDGRELSSALIGVKQPVDPGKRTLQGTWNGQVQKVELKLAEAQQEKVVLEFDPNAAPTVLPPSGEAEQQQESSGAADAAADEGPGGDDGGSSGQLWGWVSIGIGGLGFAVAGVTTFMAAGAKSDAEDACGGSIDPCTVDTSESRDAVDKYNGLRSFPLIGAIVGVVGVGVGTTLLLTSGGEDDSQAAGVRAWVGYRSAGLSGRF